MRPEPSCFFSLPFFSSSRPASLKSSSPHYTTTVNLQGDPCCWPVFLASGTVTGWPRHRLGGRSEEGPTGSLCRRRLVEGRERGPRRGQHFLDAHVSHLSSKLVAEDSIAVGRTAA